MELDVMVANLYYQKNLTEQWIERCFLGVRSVLFRRYLEIYDLEWGYFEINSKFGSP
jgi:hypothetical protein